MSAPIRCENCCWWVVYTDGEIDGLGYCHRYPPVHFHGFVHTIADEFCGEHRLSRKSFDAPVRGK